VTVRSDRSTVSYAGSAIGDGF